MWPSWFGHPACAAWLIGVAPASIIWLELHFDSYLVHPMLAQPGSICIVDDDASVRNSIERLLDSDGLKAQCFEDPEEFLAHVRSRAVPLAVLDVWMTETNGLQVQAWLREISPYTKVIVMTGRETAEIRAAALEGGAFAFLVKPLEREVFLSIVRQALRSAV